MAIEKIRSEFLSFNLICDRIRVMENAEIEIERIGEFC